jgi:raffinose/stachyose/melibiose transport system permease protein
MADTASPTTSALRARQRSSDPATTLATKKPARKHRRRSPAPWVLALPAILAVVAVRFVPSIFGASYAFTDWNGDGASADWIGFRNFRQILDDPVTRKALINTFTLAGALVVIVNVLGLALALALRRTFKTRGLMRAMFFLPFALSHLASGYVWQYIFQYDGPLNRFLGLIGLESQQRTWLADPTWALYTVLTVLVWQYTGLAMVIYLAGLEGISGDLEDAAAVDGASAGLKFWRITLPLLAPAVTVSATLTLIFGLGAFDQVLSLTGGGPVNSTETLATQVWRNTFIYGRFGYGSALALILTVIVAVLSVLQVSILRARENNL